MRSHVEFIHRDAHTLICKEGEYIGKCLGQGSDPLPVCSGVCISCLTVAGAWLEGDQGMAWSGVRGKFEDCVGGSWETKQPERDSWIAHGFQKACRVIRQCGCLPATPEVSSKFSGGLDQSDK